MNNHEKLDALLKLEMPEHLPRVSIYLPTHRTAPDNQNDPIQFKNLAQQAERMLTERFPRRDWQPLIENLQRMHQDDGVFWSHTLDGMAVFAICDVLQIFHLQYRPESRVVVSKDFHLAPLLAFLERYDEAILADLSKDRLSLLSVNRYSREPFESELVLESFAELFDDFGVDANLNVGTYGGKDAGSYHGHRARPEEVEKDRKKYFRYLDQAFTELNRTDKRPILLAGTRENLQAFRDLAKGRFYLETQLDQPLSSFDEGELQDRIARALDPIYQGKVGQLQSRIHKARTLNQTAEDVDTIEPMLEEGRVAELIISEAVRVRSTADWMRC